ncbi:MAG: DUF2029 domain-containing protein [Pirellulales bacterium]|nr:DUF2029 domain-containing protein [Pirellulales bacterium]
MQTALSRDGIAADRPDGQIWIQRALTLWIVLAVAVSVKMIVQRDAHSVYPVFADAARHWWSNTSLYDDPYFFYSPTFALAFTPFGMLPNWLGGVLWNLVSIGLLVWALRVLVRDVLPGAWPPWREGLFLGLALVGSVRGIWSSQSNTLLFALAVFAAAAIIKKRWWAASALLAMSAFIKIWPVALVLLLVARWPKQLIGRFSVAAAALALLPWLTRPFGTVCHQYSLWYGSLLSRAPERWAGQRDAWTIWENIHAPVPGHWYMALQLATAAAVLGWWLWQSRRTQSVRYQLTALLSIWICWQLLFGPGTERLTYMIIAPIATWGLLVSFARKKGRVLSTAAWLMTGLLGTGGVERALLPYCSAAPVIPPLGVAAFALWLVVHKGEPTPHHHGDDACSSPARSDRPAGLARRASAPETSGIAS